MPITIDIRDLPARLDEALSKAAAGEEVLLANGGAPCARLTPIAASQRVPGLHVGAIQPADDFDAPLPDDFWAGRP